MSAASVHVGDVATLLSKELLAASQEAISAKPKFTVAISGGSLPRFLSAAVSPNRAAFQLEKWDCYLADERLVPIDNIDANYREIQTYLPQLDLVPIDPTLNVEACAKDYERKVKAGVEGEIFDLVLLGLGPDGHTCSLFPGHELVRVYV